MIIELKAVDTTSTHLRTLYALLEERAPEAFVSHERMPTRDEHHEFVASKPFLWWYLAYDLEIDEYVGAIEATDRNELGVSILARYQRQGYGTRVLQRFMDAHKPLPAIPAIRNGHWLANIAVGNRDSKRFFMTVGFQPLQETWVMK